VRAVNSSGLGFKVLVIKGYGRGIQKQAGGSMDVPFELAFGAVIILLLAIYGLFLDLSGNRPRLLSLFDGLKCKYLDSKSTVSRDSSFIFVHHFYSPYA
jgi:hypothetical protein